MSKLPQERPFGAVFPKEEYDERRRKVREAMAQEGIDLLYVTSPRNITYLSGFEIVWFCNGSLTGLALRADTEEVVFFDTYHDRMVEEFSYMDEAVFFATFPFHPTGPQLDTVIRTLEGRGMLKGTIGLEKWAYAPSPALMQAMEERMTQAGARVLDGSWIVDTLALHKSPLEIACVRKAAEIADVGIEAGRETARSGVSELEMTAAMQYAMAKAGGEEAAIRCPVTKKGFRMPHKPSTRLTLEAGEIVFADTCGVYNRYHANLCRFFSLGEPGREVREHMKVLDASIAWVIEKVLPGQPATAIGRAIDEYLESMELTGLVARGGYDLPLSSPPDWVGHTRVVGGGFVDPPMNPGFVTNYEIFSRDPRLPPVGFIDTLLMTNSGLEVLGKTPREVLVAEE